jgi:CRP-like cAMP-binding protein
VIFKEDEEVKGIFFTYDGTVKVHKHWSRDKELILRFAKKGNIIGHRGLGKDLVYPVSGTAIEPTTTCFLRLEFFQASLKVNYDFLYELMQFFATELKESERNMRNLAHMPVKDRIAQALLTLEEKFGTTTNGSINIIISRQDLASFAGTSYETLFRVLNELIFEKIIEIHEKRFRIINKRLLMPYLR